MSWLIFSATLSLAFLLSLLISRLVAEYQHRKLLRKIQQRIRIQQRVEESNLHHRMMVEQGIMGVGDFRRWLDPRGIPMEGIVRQDETDIFPGPRPREEAMEENQSVHSKITYRITDDGRSYWGINSSDIRLCSTCGCVTATEAMDLHYWHCHPEWKPGVKPIALVEREEESERNRHAEVERRRRQRSEWLERERQQFQQSRNIRVEVEQPSVPVNEQRREFRAAVETLHDRAVHPADQPVVHQASGWVQLGMLGRIDNSDPREGLAFRERVMETRCVQCMRHLPTLHDAWTALDGTTPLCHDCFRMRGTSFPTRADMGLPEVIREDRPENRGATASLSTFDEARRLLAEPPDIDELVRQSIMAQLRVTEPGES